MLGIEFLQNGQFVFLKLLVVLLVTIPASQLVYAKDNELASIKTESHKNAYSLADVLYNNMFSGTWVHSRNYHPPKDATEEELIAEPYSDYSLTFTYKSGATECEGIGFYKPANRPLGDTRIGKFRGTVTLLYGVLPYQNKMTDHFVVRDDNRNKTKEAIAIEWIDSDTINVTEFQGAQLGGLGISFSGQYKRKKAELK